MLIERLNWDSCFFELEIGCCNSRQFQVMQKEAQEYDLLYLKDNEPMKETPFHSYDRTCILVDCKRLYSKQVVDTKFQSKYEIREYKDNSSILQELYKLAYLSGTYSRFKIDENFPLGKFEEMYRAWVDNSISGDIANYLYYVETGGKIVAFVTLKMVSQKGIIGLIATDENMQGHGIGRALIAKCEDTLRLNGISILEVSTQANNQTACLFYERCGMSLVGETYIYHSWKQNKIK